MQTGNTQAYGCSRAGDLTAHTHTLSGTANTWTLGYSKAHQLVSEAASNAAWGHVAGVDETTSYGAANSLNQYVTVTQRGHGGASGIVRVALGPGSSLRFGRDDALCFEMKKNGYCVGGVVHGRGVLGFAIYAHDPPPLREAW